MSRREVNFSVDGLSGTATVTHERETWTDPSSTTVEDIELTDDYDGAELDYDDLDPEMQAKVDEAAIEASKEREG